MIKFVPAGTALCLVLASGIVHGVWTDRWRSSDLPQVWATRVCDVPLVIGDWEGEPLEMDARSREIAQIDGYLLRRYVQRHSRQEVVVSVVCGRPGPVGAHTPDVCFWGSGYDAVQRPARFEALDAGPGGPAEFWTARFHRPDDPAAPQVRVFWAWSAAGPWRAVAYPRVEFARCPALYKLYVGRTLQRQDEPLERDPAVTFLRLLLPELRRALFPDRPGTSPPDQRRSGGV
jgi:hypothetical protein